MPEFHMMVTKSEKGQNFSLELFSFLPSIALPCYEVLITFNYCVKPKSAEYCINQKQWQGQHLTKTHLKRFPASIPALLLPHSCPTSFDSDSRFGPKVDQKWDKSGTFSDQSAELLYCRLFKKSRICPN